MKTTRPISRSPIRRSSSSAFTILETMIALMLVSVLMAVVWSVLSNFTMVAERSHNRVSDLEITRSIHRQLQDDMDHLLVFSDPERGDGFRSQSNASVPGEIMFSGSKERIQFLIFDRHVSNPTALETTPQATGGLDAYRVVTYQWQTLRDESATKLGSIVSESRGLDLTDALDTESEPNRPTPRRAWVRSVLSYHEYLNGDGTSHSVSRQLENFATIEIGLASNRSDSTNAIPQPQDTMEEIATVSWRFFDGHQWRSNWDSRTEDSFPIAVELNFETQEVTTKTTPRSSRSSDSRTVDSIEIGDLDLTSDRLLDNVTGQPAGAALESGAHRILVRIGVDPSNETVRTN
ncbi:MAG: type II secretory pathway component PulJ [Mariniblastus sp.]|jgi:type II secretory pathway component PulJ